MRTDDRGNERGAVLALVVLGMSVLAVLALAGVESTRLGLRASRAGVAATAALFAADEGLDAWVGGDGPTTGAMALEVPPGGATIEARRLMPLSDGTMLIDVISRGAAVDGRDTLRRVAAVVAHVDTVGRRTVVSGSWREEF